MTLSEFPFLTIELVEKQGVQLLGQLVPLVPEAAPWVAMAQILIPRINKIGFVQEELQHILDWLNKLTGKTAPAVTG